MEFRKIGFQNSKSFPATSTNVDIDLTDEEMKFELKDKIKLLARLFNREVIDEDNPPVHLM